MSLHEFEESLRKKNIHVNLNKHEYFTIESLSLYLENKSTINFAYPDTRNIIRLLENDFSSYDMSDRLNQIKKLGKNGSTKRAVLLRYGKKEGEKIYKKRCEEFAFKSSKEYYIEKYGEEEGIKKLKLKCPNNVETLKEKYPEEWEKKLDNYLNKYKKANSIDRYIEKYGKEEGIKRYKNVQKSKGSTLEKYEKKYGKEEGIKKYEERKKKQSYRMSKQYYIDTYGYELGLIIFKQYTITECTKKKFGKIKYELYIQNKKDIQSKPIRQQFIEKYGEKNGEKKYESYIKKQQYAHTLNYFIEKYGVELGEQKYNDTKIRLLHNFQNKRSTSNISKELFKELQKIINDTCFFSDAETKNKEFFIADKDRLYFYDFTFKNKIIEFNGDFWHMNPLKYKSADVNKLTKMTAEEIWDYDLLKQKIAETHNFKVLVIWEHEYKKNKNEIINNCINFLKG